MGVIEKAIEFESRKHVYKSTNEKIVASREVKGLILDLNEIYKENKDPEIMDIMKDLQLLKEKLKRGLRVDKINHEEYFNYRGNQGYW